MDLNDIFEDNDNEDIPHNDSVLKFDISKTIGYMEKYKANNNEKKKVKSKIKSLVIKSEKTSPLPNKFQTLCCKCILPDDSASALKCVSFCS